ncbi:MAG: hypothetical protein RLY86_2471 [Pseudomonadota bacterium]|jgi:CBS domain-containing protein
MLSQSVEAMGVVPAVAEEVAAFLAATAPFALLPEGERHHLSTVMGQGALAAGAVLMRPGERVEALSLVRTGALETRSPEGHLLARLAEGDAAGLRALLAGGIAVNRITALEDTVLYLLPRAEFERLRAEHPSFAYFFAPQGGDRLRGAKAGPVQDRWGLSGQRVADLLKRDPVTIGRDATIREAAVLMSEHRISCLPVVVEGRLCGILTDRDLRCRVIAAGRSPEERVEAVMTPDPRSIDAGAWLFEAMLLMSRHSIHHLPVVRGGRAVGVVTATDLLRPRSRSLVYLAGDVMQRDDPHGIADALRAVPDMVNELVEGGASAYSIGHAVSALSDAATQRLIQLGEEALGPAPVPYVWLAAGSQGRNEQTARSDQDNCLLIDDAFDPARHGEWFERFANFVCDGLDVAGYVHCPGGIMAKTPRWRMTVGEWRRTFAGWIHQPEPEALMYASVFFDMRPVVGATALFDTLQEAVLRQAKGSRLFLGHLVGNALTHQPPLGIFRNLVLISGGEHDRTLDLKMTGIAPIVDLARVYALDGGLAPVNSHDRIEQAAAGGVVSPDGARDLLDALEFLALVRLRHQVRLMRAGRKADNFLTPDELSPFERGHLKDAFSVVKSMQQAAVASYRGGRI